jgi:hypothetical protein
MVNRTSQSSLLRMLSYSLWFGILSGTLAIVADALGVILHATLGDGGRFISQHQRMCQMHITNTLINFYVVHIEQHKSQEHQTLDNLMF